MSTTTGEDPDGLEALIRRFRVRSEASREVSREGERRRTASLELRLWATLARGAGGLPGEPACRDAVRAVTRVAAAVLAQEGGALLGDVEPSRQALYDSRQFPGCDEVFVAIRLPLRLDADGLGDEDREARLRVLRGRLDLLGVFEGRWRERPASHPPEAWAVQPPGAAFRAAAPEPGGPRRAA